MPKAFAPIPPLKTEKYDSSIYSLVSDWQTKQLETLRKYKISPAKSEPNKKAPVAKLMAKDEEASTAEINLQPFSFSYEINQTAFSLSKDIKDIFIEKPTEKDNTPLKQILDNLEQWKNGDPLKDKEYARLQDDFETYSHKTPRQEYTFNNDGCQKLENFFNINLNEGQESLKKMEEDILTLANHLPENENDKAIHQLKVWGESRKVLTLEELIVNFGRNDPKLLTKRNPALQVEEINALYSKIGDYLLLATLEQQKRRAKSTFDKYKDAQDELEKKELLQQLASDLTAERCYDPNKKPAYLAFEYFADILIRNVQVQKLDNFLQSGDLSPVMEMIMGSGKSKVLLPLLGLLRTNKDTLSMLIVPSALYESISSDTQKILHEAFGQMLHTLHFDRNTKFTKHSLKIILDDLKTIRKNNECLIMTAKSVQCLLLKFIEQFDQFYQNNATNELPVELKLMQEIIRELQKSGYPLIDEADSVLNVLHEVSFSVGKKCSPNPNEIKIISELYKLLYSEPSLKSIARLESDPDSDPNAPVLTEKLYEETLKRPLAEAFVEKLKTIALKTPELTNRVQQFALKLNDQKNILIDYLCHTKSKIKEAQAYYNKLHPDIQDIIALAGEEIEHLLPHTLARNCDEKYGLEDGEVIASPFAAALTPNKGSRFANPYISQNYTIQTHIKKGISQNVILHEIKHLQQKAIQELKEQGDNKSLENTEAWKLFSKMKGDLEIPLFNYKPSHLELIGKKINSSIETKLSFVTDLILPEMEMFEKKLSCNPQNLVALFKKVSGFTGTLWNAASMHPKLTAMPEKGTDAKTISLLWKNSHEAVHIMKEGSTDHMLDQVFKQGTFDLISDAGGYFKEGGNLSVARKLAMKSGKSVVFYNEQGEQAITDGKTEELLAHSEKKEHERLTFLDQSHTTGADVKQKQTAIGLVTIGRNMLLRDLLQSVWRLRGLDKAQKVQFVISQEVESIMRQALNKPTDTLIFDDILRFAINNQAKQQGSDNYKALKQQLSNIPQQIVLSTLLSENVSLSEQKDALALLESHWVKQGVHSPRVLYGNLAVEQESQKCIDDEKAKCISCIKECFAKLPFLQKTGLNLDKCLKEAEDIAIRLKGCLHSHLIAKETNDDQSVETEQETELETELETEEHHEEETVELGQHCGGLQKCEDLKDELFIIGQGKSLHFSLDLFLMHDKVLKDYAMAFEGIDLTLSVLEWPKNNPQISDLKLLGNHRTPFHFMLVKAGKVILLSQPEAIMEYKNDPNLYNLTLGFCNSNKSIDTQLLEKIVKIKFLNGDSDYSKEEQILLKQWFIQEGVEKMQKLYADYIVSGYPQKALAFEGSCLQKAFKEAIKEETSLNAKLHINKMGTPEFKLKGNTNTPLQSISAPAA